MKINSPRIINPYIEIIRVLGILLLVFYHIGCMKEGHNSLENIFFFAGQKGWIGTDLFLVIAGYFFYNSFTKRYNNNPFSYGKSRFIRIVPGYYIFLLIYLTLGIKMENLMGNHFSLPTGYWLYFLTFTANIPMAFGYWSGIALEGLFGISLLVQLFILFSLLFFLIRKKNHRIFLIIILEIFIFLVRFHPLLRKLEWFSYFFTLTRMDGFLMGTFLGLLKDTEKGKHFLETKKYLLLGIGLTVLIVSAPFSGWIETTHPLTACIVFPAISLFFTSLLNFILTLQLPNWSFYTGDFVFSLYLAKLPLIYIVKGFVQNINDSFNTPSGFLIISFAACLAWGLITHFINIRRKRIKGTNF